MILLRNPHLLENYLLIFDPQMVVGGSQAEKSLFQSHQGRNHHGKVKQHQEILVHECGVFSSKVMQVIGNF